MDIDGVRHPAAAFFDREDRRCEKVCGTVDFRSTSRNKIEKTGRGDAAAVVDGDAPFAVELPRNSRQIRPADTVEFWRHGTSVRQHASFICDCRMYSAADEPLQ